MKEMNVRELIIAVKLNDYIAKEKKKNNERTKMKKKKNDRNMNENIHLIAF